MANGNPNRKYLIAAARAGKIYGRTKPQPSNNSFDLVLGQNIYQQHVSLFCIRTKAYIVPYSIPHSPCGSGP